MPRSKLSFAILLMVISAAFGLCVILALHPAQEHSQALRISPETPEYDVRVSLSDPLPEIVLTEEDNLISTEEQRQVKQRDGEIETLSTKLANSFFAPDEYLEDPHYNIKRYRLNDSEMLHYLELLDTLNETHKTLVNERIAIGREFAFAKRNRGDYEVTTGRIDFGAGYPFKYRMWADRNTPVLVTISQGECPQFDSKWKEEEEFRKVGYASLREFFKGLRDYR